MQPFAFSTFTCCLLAWGLLVGCSSKPGKPPTFPVTGTVTWQGKPLAEATVVFVPKTEGVEPATGITDESGKYLATTYGRGDGAQAGEYLVKVSKYDKAKATPEEQKRYMSHDEEQKIYAANERPTPPSKNLLPKKYADEKTSGLVHTVTKGPTTLDIAIE